jgi:ABC-type polysaccharide/polyol phosphate export permease
MGAIWSPLRTQLRVIGALTLREMITRYGRHNIGFLWLFVEPMLFTLGVAALWTFSGLHRQSSIPIVAFAVTGYSAVLLWRNMPARCVGAVEPNLALLYHRQVKILDVFLARLLLEAAGATISFMVLVLIFVSVGWMRAPEDLLKVAVGWLMLAWFGMSLALLLGSLSARSEVIEKLWHPASYLLFPLSGAAFMVDALPKQAQEAVLWLPMVHALELLRDGYFGATVRTHYSFAYLVTACLVLTALGLAQQRLVSRNVIPQ